MRVKDNPIMTTHYKTIATSKSVHIRIFFLDKLLIARGIEKTGSLGWLPPSGSKEFF